MKMKLDFEDRIYYYLTHGTTHYKMQNVRKKFDKFLHWLLLFRDYVNKFGTFSVRGTLSVGGHKQNGTQNRIE